mgnify:CR=1 FL=1
MDFQELSQSMTDFVQNSELNIVPELEGLRIFDLPLIGVAAAADPLFEKLKEPDVVGPKHLSPTQWLAGARSVIAYFLPFTAKVRNANRFDGLPATEWLYGRIEGERLNNALRTHLLNIIAAAGYEALSPAFDPRFAVTDRRSNWSERHVAFVAGLGTFSLNRSLITKAGAAGRLGSVVTNMPLQPTLRDYVAAEENCHRCGACIRRCPAGAISEAGKDNELCSAFLDETKRRFEPRYGCGKCQTGVPCEDRIPGRRRG